MDTSRDISDAVIRNLRNSANAGFCCCCCEEGSVDDRVLMSTLLLDEEELAAVIPPPPPARIALMAPVAGMDRANAKNSSLRSAIAGAPLVVVRLL